jgi:hypothetical protein
MGMICLSVALIAAAVIIIMLLSRPPVPQIKMKRTRSGGRAPGGLGIPILPATYSSSTTSVTTDPTALGLGGLTANEGTTVFTGRPSVGRPDMSLGFRSDEGRTNRSPRAIRRTPG